MWCQIILNIFYNVFILVPFVFLKQNKLKVVSKEVEHDSSIIANILLIKFVT